MLWIKTSCCYKKDDGFVDVWKVRRLVVLIYNIFYDCGSENMLNQCLILQKLHYGLVLFLIFPCFLYPIENLLVIQRHWNWLPLSIIIFNIMNTHKNSSNSFTPNPETNHQQNYLPYYNYQNFFPIFNQHASNSYFHNMNLLAGKPHLTPSSIGDPKKISSSFNEQSGINHPLQGTSMGFHGSFMDYLYHVENMRVAMI